MWRNDLGQRMSDATLVFSLSKDGYNVLIDDWLILLWLYYALMDTRLTELPAPETGSAASGEDPNEEDDALRTDAMCPNMRMAPFALRYDCTPWASHTSGEMVCRVSREPPYQGSGRVSVGFYAKYRYGCCVPSRGLRTPVLRRGTGKLKH